MAYIGPKQIEQMVLQADYYRILFLLRSDQAKVIRDMIPNLKDSRSRKLAMEDVEHLTNDANRFNDRSIEIGRLIGLAQRKGRGRV